MDANELGRWTRFAAKGGIGKCVAVQDCIAEEDEDLMFLRDDEIVVLMQLTAHEDLYLGYCEGVVGRFNASNVRFLSRLKRPVMTKRNSRSLSRSSSRPPSAQGRESLSALAHRDSPSLPHATRRTSPSHPVAAAPAAETSNLMSSALPSASLPSSPHSQLDHLRCVSHSSTSTTVDSTPRTPAEFQIEQSTTGPVRIVDIPTQDDDSVYEHKQSEAEENALLYTDDLIDDDPSYTDSEPSTHISFDVSEGTSAIGLSLLRDFVNGEVDDGMSVHSLSGSVSTVDERVSSGIVAQVTDRSPRSSVYSLGSTRNESRGRQSPSRTSQQPSNVSSDYGSDEWDGASDIYDNYRYSRASMASKMSRFSKGSLHTVASGLGLDAPPLPISDSHRPSLDSMRHGAGSARDRLGLITTASSSIEDVKQTVQPADSLAAETANPADIGTSSRHIPPPLDLTLSNHTRMPSSTTQSFPSSSPLLHSAFHSPLSSPDAQSPTYLSPTSTPSTAPLYSAVPGGAATALRQRLERSKGSVPATRAIESTFADLQPDLRGKARLSSQPIVVDDDEGQLDTSIDTAAQHSPSTSSTSFSAAEEKKKMIETTYIVVNQAPPPPYTLTPSTEASAADATTNVPIPRASVEQGAASSSSSRTSAFVRRSLFLPHPHAPKPAEVPNGPMYGRTPVVAGQSFSDGPPPGSVAHTLHLALSAFGDPFRPRIVTIYAQFDRDLATSVGPVPVSFSLVPQNNIPAHHPKPSAPVLQPEADALDGQQMSMSSNKPIPRPNFFPQTPSIRPRSRSFSDFDTSGHKGLATADQSSELKQHVAPLVVSRSKSTIVSSSVSSATSRQQHKPSPLSMPSNNVVAALNRTRAPPSPLSQQPASLSQARSPISPLPFDAGPPVQGMSTDISNLTLASPVTEPASLQEDAQSAKSPVSRSGSLGTSPTSPTSPLKFFPVQNIIRHSRSSTFASNQQSGGRDHSPSRSSTQGRKSGDSDTTHHSDAHVSSNTASGPSMPSLRSKLSLPTLKIRGGERSSHTDERSPTLSVNQSEVLAEQPTVHVKDVDFELVIPSVQQLTIIDEDPPMSPLASPVRPDIGNALRSSSPALSILSGFSSRTKSGQTALPQQPSSPPASSPDLQDVEAHRQRELRWITTMASNPASQARKSKKVRKLLYEGVPASVRYLVWAHLADSKAKRMDNLYTKLIMRDRVPASVNIERDVQRVFAEESQLLDGSLMNLLQAYFSMVPDTQYSRGLTVIAGRLLLQSPEEDAFWTFVSMMDCHLRPYFSPSRSQLEVDATLFAKALEAIEPNLAKKIFSEMDIPPISLCRPWFTALFLEALPFDHSQRVWDIFLFEGITFLYRVGLAIIQCCKSSVVHCSDRDTILRTLLHPPASMLPTSADAFLEIASSVKFKDEDVRKQRGKLDLQQTKRLTQVRNPLVSRGGTPSVTPLRPSISSISLPRSNSGAEHGVNN